MVFPNSFFEDEVRDGFYVSARMKRAWAAQLEVLEAIDQVCKKHDIQYFAEWGTLLGAIRHGGFIPWDDDMDLCMRREDYDKFRSVADELPEGYHLWNDYTTTEFNDVLSRVVNGDRMNFDKEYLDRFHGCPYMAGIDIFPLDYIAPTTQEKIAQKNTFIATVELLCAVEKGASDEEIEALKSQIEDLCQIKIDKDKPIKNQLCLLADHICSRFKNVDSEQITIFPLWAVNESYAFPKNFYQESILVPFENTLIPVPLEYDAILKRKYGNYMYEVRAWDTHNYPFYAEQDQILLDKYGLPMLEYQISAEELCKAQRQVEEKPKKRAEKFTNIMKEAHMEILQSIVEGRIETACELLELCQNGAIELGDMLEAVEGENFPAIRYIEEYCENVYQLHEKLISNNPKQEHWTLETMEANLYDIKGSIRLDIQEHRTVVFLPYKASMWKSMEGIWQAANEDPDCDAYVIPIPYYERDAHGNQGSFHDETALFPKDVPVVRYDTYDFVKKRPDVIFIHNPYDNCDPATSVHPFFYSKNLRKYTDQLVYVPRFYMDDFAAEDKRAKENVKHFCMMPGLVYSDLVIVQSEEMRQRYIEILTELVGEETRSIWENKIVGGGPSIIENGRIDFEIPKEWLKIIVKPDGTWKKILLYNTSAASMLRNGERMLADMKHLFLLLKNNQEENAFIWYTHPLFCKVLKYNRPELWEDYNRLTEVFKEEGWGIYDDSPHYERVASICDSIYGDWDGVVGMGIGNGVPFDLQKEIEVSPGRRT